jgi:putative NADH-flavin reductase
VTVRARHVSTHHPATAVKNAGTSSGDAGVKVLIVGATGSLGRHLVSQALARGHDVTALVRDPSTLDVPDGRLHVVPGDALDPVASDAAVRGQDAVIVSLGRRRHRTRTTLFSDATRVLIAAMEKHGVRRLIAVTGIGAGDSRGHGGFLYDRIIFPFIVHNTYADKDRQEDLIRHSSLDWVIVRPASFTNGPLRDRLRVATDLEGVTIRSISRADAAAFVLDQLTGDRHRHQTPLVGY